MDEPPATCSETVSPDGYPFRPNVTPAVPHPRWSQRTEKVILSGDERRTLLDNGYASVPDLYKGEGDVMGSTAERLVALHTSATKSPTTTPPSDSAAAELGPICSTPAAIRRHDHPRALISAGRKGLR